MDDGEKMFGGAAGSDGLEPVGAFPVVGVEEGKLGVAGADRGAGAADFIGGGGEGAGLLREKRMENAREGRGCAVAGDIVIAFDEHERDAEPRVAHVREGLGVLPRGEPFVAAEPLDEVAHLKHEGKGGGGAAIEVGDHVAECREEARHDLGGEARVVFDLIEIVRMFLFEPREIVVSEFVVV